MLQVYFDDENFNQKFKVYLRSRPNIPVAEMEYESIPVPQSDTTLTRELGYKPTEFELYFNFISKNEKPKMREIANWLTTKERLHFGDDPGVYRIIKKLNFADVYNDLEQLVGFTLLLETEPFWFEDHSTIRVSDKTNIFNPSIVPVDANLVVHGTGTCKISVNGQEIVFNSVDGHVSIQQKNAHKHGLSQNHNMVGAYPVFEPGNNEVSIVSGATSIDVKVRWAYR